MDIHILQILASILFISLCSAVVVFTPSSLNVIEGYDAEITCSSYGSGIDRIDRNNQTTHLIGNVWMKNCSYFGFLSDSLLYEVKCLSVSANVITIVLKNISGNTDGEEWKCYVDFNGSNTVTVHVTVPVSSVTIKPSNALISAEENDTIQLSCTSSFGRPKPKVTWYLSMEGQAENAADMLELNETVAYTYNNEGHSSVRSNVTLRVKTAQNGRFIHCAASNHPERTAHSASILLDIKNAAKEFEQTTISNDVEALGHTRNDKTAVVVGSVFGVAVLLGILLVLFFVMRRTEFLRKYICFQRCTKPYHSKTNADYENNELDSGSGPQTLESPNTYETIRNENGDASHEYDQITTGNDDVKNDYENIQQNQTSTSN